MNRYGLSGPFHGLQGLKSEGIKHKALGPGPKGKLTFAPLPSRQRVRPSPQEGGKCGKGGRELSKGTSRFLERWLQGSQDRDKGLRIGPSEECKGQNVNLKSPGGSGNSKE